ncbi:MAG: hypothetical protein HON43_06280 [Alphaproteobacteria bacterium]|jgi:hypothetical protein|nr:hypothetical protein [Alphaproteobacteria bacterium]MBT5390338.1 hypothetical protein [Alphaproteobacteria bacterium]
MNLVYINFQAKNPASNVSGYYAICVGQAEWVISTNYERIGQRGQRGQRKEYTIEDIGQAIQMTQGILKKRFNAKNA